MSGKRLDGRVIAEEIRRSLAVEVNYLKVNFGIIAFLFLVNKD